MLRFKTIKRREVACDALSAFPDMHPVLARVFAGRGITQLAELTMELQHLLPYDSLKNIEKAVHCLIIALQAQKRFLIIGDFDADGATSTAIAVKALRKMGARNVDFLVPNRFNFGYGLSPEIVTVALTYQPDILITVDTGISSYEGVALAKAHGVQVIITDHHLPGDTLPAADAIVNPNQPHDEFPSKQLAGCGVIFYVMLALRAHLREQSWFITQQLPEPNLAELLDLVALGTVADLVPLDRNNRILVSQGLARIRAGRSCFGIQALLQASNRQVAYIQASDLAFAVAPRLNAAGRLTDMRLGIDCLLAETLAEAMRFAHELDRLNQERRDIEATMQHQALQAVHKLHLNPQQAPTGIVLYDASWHQGVIGIVAGRIKERLHRPVIAFAKVSTAELKGSARSIPGLNIRNTLEVIVNRHPQLIHKFGGHAMAAGLSIHPDSIAEFCRLFDVTVREMLTGTNLDAIILSDGMLSADELTVSMAQLVAQAGPWGQTFPEPIFDGVFQLVEQRLLQGKHLKLGLKLPTSDRIFKGICFNVDVDHWPNHRCQQVHLAYRLDINRYGGHHHLQLMVEHLLAFDESL